MKLEIGKGSYQIAEPIGMIQRITVSDVDGGHGSFKVLMAQVGMVDIIAHRQRDSSFGGNGLFDMPTLYCFIATRLEIWPRPDKEYHAVITYYPPALQL